MVSFIILGVTEDMKRKIPSDLEYRNGFVYNWFSNFKPFEIPMEYEGLVFKTPEAFYQSMKTEDPALRVPFQDMTAGQSKRAGSKLEIIYDWEDGRKVYVMQYALYYKFSEGTEWRKRLDDTKGEIIEWNNWHDNSWGDCICPKCEDIEGQNLLGKLLMEIRDGKVTIDNEFF